jgi:hypothetical protein
LNCKFAIFIHAQEQERIDEITDRNNGVFFSAMLYAMAADSLAIASKGIKRAEDKVRVIHIRSRKDKNIHLSCVASQASHRVVDPLSNSLIIQIAI